MVKRTHIAAIKIFAVVLLIYNAWFFSGFLFPVLLLSVYNLAEGFDLATVFRYLLSHPSLLAIGLLCAYLSALIYIIASIGILRLKNWARKLAVYNSCLAIVIYILIWLASVDAFRLLASFAPVDMEYVIFKGLFTILIYMVPPILFILFFLTRPQIKDSFKKDVTQESKGVATFAILVIILALFGGRDSYQSHISFYKISQPYLDILFWFGMLTEIIIVLTALGLFWLKDAFRKIAVILLSFDLACFPFQLFLIDKTCLFSDVILVFLSVVFFIIFLLFDAVFIYYFTRPRVKLQFATP